MKLKKESLIGGLVLFSYLFITGLGNTIQFSIIENASTTHVFESLVLLITFLICITFIAVDILRKKSNILSIIGFVVVLITSLSRLPKFILSTDNNLSGIMGIVFIILFCIYSIINCRKSQNHIKTP